MIEEGILKFLKTNTAIVATLGHGTATNSVFMGFIPETADFPALMFEEVTNISDQLLAGPGSFTETRFQFTAEAKDVGNTPGNGYVAAKSVMRALRQQLNGLGPINLADADSTRMFNAMLDNKIDGYDEEGMVYRSVHDYLVQYSETP